MQKKEGTLIPWTFASSFLGGDRNGWFCLYALIKSVKIKWKKHAEDSALAKQRDKWMDLIVNALPVATDLFT